MYHIYWGGKDYTAGSPYGLVNLLKKDGCKNAEYVVEKSSKPLRQEFNPVEKKSTSFSDAVTGAKALLRIVAGDKVPQEEINRRAAICTSCPMVSGVSNCRACGFGGQLTKFVNATKASFGKDFKIPNGLSDKYCSVCTCSLLMMLPSNMEAFQESAEKQGERPNHCWVKKTSPNYQDENL